MSEKLPERRWSERCSECFSGRLSERFSSERFVDLSSPYSNLLVLCYLLEEGEGGRGGRIPCSLVWGHAKFVRDSKVELNWLVVVYVMPLGQEKLPPFESASQLSRNFKF